MCYDDILMKGSINRQPLTSGNTMFWGFSKHCCMIWCMNILGVSRWSLGAASSVARASASTCLRMCPAPHQGRANLHQWHK